MRHGNTFEAGETPLQVGARTDLPLTNQGLCQAKQMVKYLASEGISPKVIFAGKLKRQTQSAQVIAEYFGLQFQDAPALTEIDYGLWEGLSSEEIVSKWPKEYAEWNELAKWQSHIFKGDRDAHLIAIEEWLNALRKDCEGKAVIAITSNGLLRFFKNEKVKTGHFCEIHLLETGIQICSWNQSPLR
jgi:2,3-bisphosphoglycerate-dependent phosphoglycerate mutase